jgi:hypothetical protein
MTHIGTPDPALFEHNTVPGTGYVLTTSFTLLKR